MPTVWILQPRELASPKDERKYPLEFRQALEEGLRSSSPKVRPNAGHPSHIGWFLNRLIWTQTSKSNFLVDVARNRGTLVAATN